MSQSLRSVLSQFEASDDLHDVERPVNPCYELGAVLALRNHGPAQFFRQVQGYTMPVVGNLLNSREKIARSLGLEPAQLQAACLAALEQGLKPEIVAEGPVQEIIQHEPLELGQLLPVPTWFEREEGPYITAGVIIAKDPETGRRNVSIA